MKLKDLMEKYGDYDVIVSRRIATDEIVIEGIKPQPKTVWDLKGGDGYFVLYHDGDIAEYKWTGDTGFGACYRDYGNIFLTEEEALKDVERRKVETLMLKHGGRRRYKRFGENFGFLIDDVDRFGIHSLNQIQGTIYFDTYSDAKTALDSIGTDRIKRALFEVEK